MYDNNGKIVKKREFSKVSLKEGLLLEEEDSKDTVYVYEGDRLVSYGGADFVYDDMGNPTTYRNMSCVWEKGRQLKSISDGANTVSFTYDEFGMRTTKTAGGITTNYVYENGKLLREVTGSEKIDFVYGSDGIIGFRTGNKNYLYRKNIYGDVTEIYSDNGTLVGKYSYTAFGECIVKVNEGGIAEKNPIRYRGYYYDEETSLYYLKSRYYDPITGRFITIDDISYYTLTVYNVNDTKKTKVKTFYLGTFTYRYDRVEDMPESESWKFTIDDMKKYCETYKTEYTGEYYFELRAVDVWFARSEVITALFSAAE